jgi:acyl carrier protein
MSIPQISDQAIADNVRAFVISNFLFGQETQAVANDSSFLETGIVDSTGILELVAHIEQQFGIAVEDGELVPANLDSIDNVTAFITRKLSAKGRF